MFDIAAVAHALGTDYVVEACSRFPDASRGALAVAEKMNPALVDAVTGKLLVSEGFQILQGHAKGVTKVVLVEAIARAG